MNKRQKKKHLGKGNCPMCMTSHRVSFLRLPFNKLSQLMKNKWIVTACDCGIRRKENDNNNARGSDDPHR